MTKPNQHNENTSRKIEKMLMETQASADTDTKEIKMNNIMIKTTCDANGTRTTLGHPDASPGNFQDGALQIRRITSIPDGVSGADVVRLYSATTIFEFSDSPMLVVDYAQLGAGRIIRSTHQAEG